MRIGGFSESYKKKLDLAQLIIHDGWAMRLVLGMLLTVFLGIAQENALTDKLPEPQREPETLRPEMRFWRLSAAGLVGASAIDIASSWGKCCERNSLLASPSRHFGARGLAVKSGTLGAQLLLQYLVVRKSPRLARVLGFVNIAGAGALTLVAIHNYRVPQRP